MKKAGLIWILAITSTGAFAQYKLYEDGLTFYKKDNYAQCISSLTDFLGRSMHDKKFDVDAYYYRALSFYKTGDYEKAVSDFQETILLNRPNKGNIYWFMAKANDKLSANDDAISNYTSAIKEMNSDAAVKSKLLFERSQLYMRTGNAAAAVDDLNAAATLDHANTDIKTALDRAVTTAAINRSTVTTREEKKDPPANATVPAGKTTVQKNGGKKDNAVVKDAGLTKQPENKNTVVVQQQPPPQAPVVAQPVAQTSAAPTLADIYKDERRFALVIGNSKYAKEVGVLKNPANDATAIAEELRKSNFDVTLLTDATYGQMRANMLKFKEKVDAGNADQTVALFYYAGHGLQHDDENYLVPVDAALEYEDDIGRYCFPVQRMVLANMERSNSRMNIVILDACRNNPFPALTRSLGQQGLGEVKRARGSFIAYATAPGSVASDGDGKNGLYTQELLKAMRKPQATIEQVFKEVRQNVLRQSGNKQNTWDSSNIVGDFYFKLQ